MTSWEDNPYWLKADEYAHGVHRQFLSQLSRRSVYLYEEPCMLNLVYRRDIENSSGAVDFIFQVKSETHIDEPDNLGFCLTSQDHCQIEIITYLPKYYRINRLLKAQKYRTDLLNVIRHEVEHMFQSGAYEIDGLALKTYNRSPENYMLDSAEVPAYVHGFRITSESNLDFCKAISRFVDAHGAALRLSQEEIAYTKKVWYNYLKNLDN